MLFFADEDVTAPLNDTGLALYCCNYDYGCFSLLVCIKDKYREGSEQNMKKDRQAALSQTIPR